MKIMRRVAICLLAMLMTVAALPLTGIAAIGDEPEINSEPVIMEQESISANRVYASSSELVYDGITRAEWLHNLVVVFEMVAEAYSMPDNYFKDLKEDHEYYEDILLAVEFGVVDIEAGGNIEPDGIVTRDFAVSTLNYCLGYQLGEDAEYTYSDSDKVSDPVSAQIALDRGWVKAVSGKFCPDEKLSEAEAKVMLDDAAKILENQVVDENYNSKYEFADDVTVISSEIAAGVDENGTVTISDCPEEIKVGDKFAVYFNGIPSVYTAKSVETKGSEILVKTEAVSTDKGFKEVDAQGVVDANVMEIVPEEGVEVFFEEEISTTYALKKLKNIKAKTELGFIPGLSGSVQIEIKNPVIDYSLKTSNAYVLLKGETEINFSVEANTIELAGLETSIPLFKCNVMGVGSFTVSVEFDLSASASGCVEGYLVAGLECSKGGYIRSVKSFRQNQSSVNVEGTASVGLKVSLGITDMPIVEAYVYAEAGMKASLKGTIYTDDKKPDKCVHFAAYLYAEYGAVASVEFGIWKNSFEAVEEIFDSSNSPVKIVHHYEDGVLVADCTRGDVFDFFTNGNSRWGGSGWSGGNGAYGLGNDGKPFALYDYTLNDNGEATITKYHGNSWSVYIPSEIDGHKVVAIGDSAFAEKDMASVVIPNSVTSIGSYAFDSCVLLSNVKLSDNLTSLGGRAFGYTAVESIVIPKSLGGCGYVLNRGVWEWEYDLLGTTYTIAGGPFYCCESLRWVSFENGITRIPDNLFRGCTGLKNIVIPNTVTNIGKHAFCGSLRLESATIPNSVTHIEDNAFQNCVSLTAISIPDSVTDIWQYAFDNCRALSNVKLSNNIKVLNGRAFGNTAIESIVIPKSLESCGYVLNRGIWEWEYDLLGTTYTIAGGPFYCCESLRWVSFENGITRIPDNLFRGCTGLKNIVIPNTVTNIGKHAFCGSLRLESATIPNSVTHIEDNAFQNCVSLTAISIPDSVTDIWQYAFDNCRALSNVKLSNNIKVLNGRAFGNTAIESIVIPKSLESCGYVLDRGVWEWDYYLSDQKYTIAGGPFYCCENLNNVTFESGITKIPDNIFRGCTGLKGVVIPNTVTEIGKHAFCGSLRLENLKLSDSVTIIKENAFEKCVSLTSISIPDSVTEIQGYAFDNCISLNNVTLSKKLVTMGGRAFGYTAIESIDIPKSLDYCGVTNYTGPFKGCDSLKKVSFEEGTTSVASNLLRGGTGVEEIVFPDSIEVIEEFSMADNLVLNKVTFGKSLKNIENGVFINCPMLEEIQFPDTLETIGSNIFERCVKLKSVEIPDSVTSVGGGAFLSCTALESVKLSNNLDSIPSGIFKGCKSLKEINIPSKAKYIYGSAFEECESLERVFFAENGVLYEIQSNAFKKCKSLKELELPEGLVNLSSDVFRDCTSLEKVDFPSTIRGIGSVFKGCTKISDVSFVDYTLKSLPSQLFMGCEALEEIVLPKGLDTINGEVFSNCKNLKKVYIPESVKKINSNVFAGADNVVIQGKKGSYSETFANENSIEFEELSIAIENISFADGIETLILDKGQSYEFKFNVYPENATDVITVTANSSDVNVEFHTVKVSKSGNYVITAKSSSGVSCQLNLHVREAKNIEVKTQPKKQSYLVGEAFDVTGLTVYANYHGNDVSTEIKNYTLSGFDSSKTGECKVTVSWSAPHGYKHTTSFVVVIKNPSVTLSESVVALAPGETVTLMVTTFPEECNVMWKSSDESVVTVSNGVLTALSDGKVTVTAEFAINGVVYSANCEVTVSAFLVGDCNGDEIIDSDDAIYLLYSVLFGADVYPLNQPSDFDGNNTVDSDDAIYLLYHILFGADAYPLK